MDNFEAGPIVLEALPLPPRVVTPRLFQALGAEIATTIAGADTGLSTQQAAIAPLATTDLSADFTALVAPALAALDGLDGGAAAGALRGLVDEGDRVDADAARQQDALPRPEDPPPYAPPVEVLPFWTPPHDGNPNDAPGEGFAVPRPPTPSPFPPPTPVVPPIGTLPAPATPPPPPVWPAPGAPRPPTGRWKADLSRPAGQQCYWDPTDSGPDQCRP